MPRSLDCIPKSMMESIGDLSRKVLVIRHVSERLLSCIEVQKMAGARAVMGRPVRKLNSPNESYFILYKCGSK